MSASVLSGMGRRPSGKLAQVRRGPDRSRGIHFPLLLRYAVILLSETRWRDSVAAASDSGPYITFAAAFPSDIRAAADCAGIPGLEEGREGRGRRTRYASTLEELASPPQINVVRVTVRQEPGFCL